MRYAILIALAFLAQIARIKCYEGCGENNLQEHTYGACDEVTKANRVIYSKTCINEYDHRNYTLGWAGEEEITCIRVKANGEVVLYSGGIGQTLAVVLVESTEGKELEFESEIYIKK